MRQLKKTARAIAIHLLEDGRAVIRVKDDLYYGIINGGEVIAISTDIDEVEQRLKRAERNIEIVVQQGNRELSPELYKLSKYSRVFRVAYSDTKAHGLIIAVMIFLTAILAIYGYFMITKKLLIISVAAAAKTATITFMLTDCRKISAKRRAGKDTFDMPRIGDG